MIKYLCHIICFICLVGVSTIAFTQADTLSKVVPVDSLVKQSTNFKNQKAIDSVRRAFSPRKATIRSAILPGWGQFYNKKYWKIPIVYGALGTAAGIFWYNLSNYRDVRFAYNAKYKASRPPFDPTYPNAPGPFRDSTDFARIKSYLRVADLNNLRFARDEIRKNIDYSVVFFILVWGLNVADAAVDAHLKAFDVSPDLSFRFKLGPSHFAGTTGVSLVLLFK